MKCIKVSYRLHIYEIARIFAHEKSKVRKRNHTFASRQKALKSSRFPVQQATWRSDAPPCKESFIMILILRIDFGQDIDSDRDIQFKMFILCELWLKTWIPPVEVLIVEDCAVFWLERKMDSVGSDEETFQNFYFMQINKNCILLIITCALVLRKSMYWVGNSGRYFSLWSI